LQGKKVDSTGWIFCNTPEEASSNPYPVPGLDCPGKPPKESGGAGGKTRGPQSMQSVPKLQSEVSAPGPPSSQFPSLAL
jgi:hypothetical protein